MLEFEHVSIAYRSRPVLQDISFRVRPGRVTVLLGRNGSGKSTLIHCANHQLSFQGQIRLNEVPIGQIQPSKRAQLLGVLPQVLPQTSLSVRELTSLGRTPYTGTLGRLSADDRLAIDQALSDAGITHLADQACSQLSGGERQRAFLALLLAQHAQTLLLDEPTTYLDLTAQRSLCSLIVSLAHEQGKAVLTVLHDLNEAIRIADDLVVLSNGQVVYTGEARACLEQHVLETVFSVTRHEYTEDGVRHFFFD